MENRKLYTDEERKNLEKIMQHLSFMGFSNKQKSYYCNLALKHLGLNINMIRLNCVHCGIKNCHVKKVVYEVGF